MLRLITTAGVMAMVAGSATAQPNAGGASGGAQLNPEDCKVMVVLGRELLHWDKQTPDISMFAIFYRPEAGRYVEQCPWRSLGVTPLPPGSPDLHNMRFFTQPRYNEDGRSVSVQFITRLVAVGSDGKPMAPFMQDEACKLSKQGSEWRFEGCAMAAIT